MTLLNKFVLSLAILLGTVSAHALNEATFANEPTSVEGESRDQGQLGDQPFLQLIRQASLAAGRCTGSYDCSWPTTQCVNNRCVKLNGDGGQCTGSYDCSWPTTECRSGNCVKPNGDGGECTGSYDCKWPYNQCKNGFCER